MSTRGFYVFKSGNESLNVYKHSDNYPEGEHGGFAAIGKAGPLAWAMPRFEADEFAAAFVAANKGTRAGNVRLAMSGDWRDVCPGDVEYVYVIEGRNSLDHCDAMVSCYAVSCDYDSGKWTATAQYSRPLAEVVGGWYPKRRKAA